MRTCQIHLNQKNICSAPRQEVYLLDKIKEKVEQLSPVCQKNAPAVLQQLAIEILKRTEK